MLLLVHFQPTSSFARIVALITLEWPVSGLLSHVFSNIYFSAPVGTRNCTFCRRVLLFSQAQINIEYSSLYIALKLLSCSSSLDLRGVSGFRVATLDPELELLVVDLMVAPVSEASTRLQRSLV